MLRNDKRFVIEAAQQAQKAVAVSTVAVSTVAVSTVDYIMDNKEESP